LASQLLQELGEVGRERHFKVQHLAADGVLEASSAACSATRGAPLVSGISGPKQR